MSQRLKERIIIHGHDIKGDQEHGNAGYEEIRLELLVGFHKPELLGNHKIIYIEVDSEEHHKYCRDYLGRYIVVTADAQIHI